MKILIVIPCYNEEEVLPKTLDVLGALIGKIKKETDADTELLLVDDGSRGPYSADDFGCCQGT